MLERTSSQKSEDIKIGLQVPINKDSLLQTMVYFKEMESDGIVKEWDMNDDASRGKFRAYHVLMTLMTPGETLTYAVHASVDRVNHLYIKKHGCLLFYHLKIVTK